MNPNGPHAGDLGNVTVSEKGTASVSITAKDLTLKPGPNSLMQPAGTALVLHAREDDRKTDPSGNSGDRLACGVVTGK
jgi:Cu-Zn family superoxide dismutase